MDNLFNPPRFVKGSLIGVNGNAFALLGYFTRNAKRQGWTEEDTRKVIDKATEGNYQQLITTLDSHLSEVTA